MTINDAVSSLYARIKKGNTLASYQATLEPFRILHGERECSAVVAAEVRSYLEGLIVSESTRYLRYSHLKAFFNAALNEEKIQGTRPTWENPCMLLGNAFPHPITRERFLSETIHEDMAAAEASLRGHYKLIFALGTRAGLRIGEILRITPADLVRNGHSFIRLQNQKNGKKDALAPVPLDVYLELEEYILQKNIAPEARIFPMSRQSVGEAFRIRGLKTHDMRRYAALVAVEKGKPLTVVSGMLRHSNVAVTTRYVGKLRPSKLAEDLEDM